MSQETGQSHFVYNLAINALKRVSMKSKLGIGFDLTYDGSDRDILAKKRDSLRKGMGTGKARRQFGLRNAARPHLIPF